MPSLSLLLPGFLLLSSPQIMPDTLRSIESLIEFDPGMDLDLLLEDLEDLEPDPPGMIGEGDALRRRRGGSDCIIFGLASEDPAGAATEWHGSPVRWWLRSALRPLPGIEAGFMMEKDAGERANLGSCSGFLSAEGIVRGLRCTIGDYRLEPGSGLLFGRGTGRVGSWSAFSRAGPGREALVPNRGRSEFGYLRGGALEYSSSKRAFSLALFAASRNLPGHQGESGFVLDRVGNYRTSSEEGWRGGTTESMYGIRGEARLSPRLWLSSTLAVARLKDQLDGSKYGLSPASRFLFVQTDGRLVGEDGTVALDVVRESKGGWGAALSWCRNVGGESGFLAKAEARSPEYWDYRQTGSESNRVRLEWGSVIPLSPSVMVRTWIGHWQRFRPLEGEFSPLRGSSLGLGVELKLSSGGVLTIDVTRSNREEEFIVSVDQRGSSRRIVSKTRTTLRPGVHIHLRKGLEWELKGAGALFRRSDSFNEEAGAGCVQEFRWSPFPWCSLRCWMTLYSAPSYDCAIYFFEPDPIRSGTLSGCYGEGERNGATCTLSHRDFSATIYWSASSRTAPGGASMSERSYAAGFRISCPL